MKIKKLGKHWYVLHWWWRLSFPGLPPSPFMRGTDAFNEVPIGFLSEEIAKAALKKYPNGEIAVELPFLPAHELLTVAGQTALVKQ